MGTTLPFLHVLGNAQTCISCEVFCHDSGCTPASLLMARRRELSEFERIMIMSARQMGHSISKVVRTFHHGHRRGQSRMLNDGDQQHLARIVPGNRQVSLAEITFTFNADGTRGISSRLMQCSLASTGYG
jgi:hypothetical protein